MDVNTIMMCTGIMHHNSDRMLICITSDMHQTEVCIVPLLGDLAYKWQQEANKCIVPTVDIFTR